MKIKYLEVITQLLLLFLLQLKKKISNVSNLIKKSDYAAKLSDIENKYCTKSG